MATLLAVLLSCIRLHHLISQTDSLGSVLATSKANKSIAARYDYDAWGKELNNTDTSDNPLGFTGHQMDRESENKTGLIYANARYLDPDTGRFLSFDPFEGYDEKPISLHRYMYAYQNPVRYTDPDGEVAVLAAVGAYLAYTAVMSVFDTASEAAIDATVSHVTGNESNFDAVSSFGENMLINAATFGAAGKVKTTARIAEAADTINDARKVKSATKTTKENPSGVNSKVESPRSQKETKPSIESENAQVVGPKGGKAKSTGKTNEQGETIYKRDSGGHYSNDASTGKQKIEKSPSEHGNVAGDQPAECYALVCQRTGEVKKYGETTHGEDIYGKGNQKRYTPKEMKKMEVDYKKLESGTKKDMKNTQTELIQKFEKQNGRKPELNKTYQ